MHLPVIGESLNDLTVKTCERLLTEGVSVDSRNGGSRELSDISLFLNNPRDRHLYLKGRTNNIFGTIGEVFWLLAKKNEIHPVLSIFVPRAENYSDDGETWRAGYGARMFVQDQIKGVVDTFVKDGKNTRRAVMAIWQPELDSAQALEDQGYPNSKDIPCSNFLWFWIRDNKLHCKLGMRSNDWIFGGSNINVFEFTILQELILCLIKQAAPDVFRDVDLGYYHHSVISLHLYDATMKQAENILANKETNSGYLVSLTNYPIQLGDNNYHKTLGFFGMIYTCLYGAAVNQPFVGVDKVFTDFAVPKENNQLYGYALLAEAYLKISHKRTVDFKGSILPHLSPDLRQAISLNKFTPAEWFATT